MIRTLYVGIGIGIVVLVLGGILLLWNLGYLPQLGRLWPVPMILVGLVFLYMTWPRGHSDRWLLPSKSPGSRMPFQNSSQVITHTSPA